MLGAICAGAVKSFLMARISEYRAQVVSQYQTVVPREKASFEAAFDSFVEACLVRRQTTKDSTKREHIDEAGKGKVLYPLQCLQSQKFSH